MMKHDLAKDFSNVKSDVFSGLLEEFYLFSIKGNVNTIIKMSLNKIENPL